MTARVLIVTAAAAVGYGTPWCTGNPPPRFEHSTTAIVHFSTPAELAAECGQEAAACSLGREVWARNPCDMKDVSDLDSLDSDLCHEIGHVNGWPKNHPR